MAIKPQGFQLSDKMLSIADKLERMLDFKAIIEYGTKNGIEHIFVVLSKSELKKISMESSKVLAR